jgi:cation transport protein ChaC
MPPSQPADPGQLVEIADVLAPGSGLSETRDDIWVFGYGSLMWMPGFEYRMAVPARLQGWHRRFSLLSVKAWGTPERPGLSAALHPGGSVLGVAFAVAPEHQHETLAFLGRREAAYRQAPICCVLPGGHKADGLTYVARPDNGRFLEDPDVADQAKHIRQGDGPKGTSLFYLESTVHCLNKLGSGPTSAHRLLDQIRD